MIPGGGFLAVERGAGGLELEDSAAFAFGGRQYLVTCTRKLRTIRGPPKIATSIQGPPADKVVLDVMESYEEFTYLRVNPSPFARNFPGRLHLACKHVCRVAQVFYM